jgi:hypothetical protein
MEKIAWTLDTPLAEIAKDYENKANNPDLHRVFFKVNGKVLPGDKTLRELHIDPTRQTIEIVHMYLHSLFDDSTLWP